MIKNKKDVVYDLQSIDIDTIIALINNDELKDFSKTKNFSVLSYDKIYKLLENEKIIKMIIKDNGLIHDFIKQNNEVENVILDKDYCNEFIDMFDNDIDILTFVFNNFNDSRRIFNNFMNNNKFLKIIARNANDIDGEMKRRYILNFPATKGYMIQDVLASYAIKHPDIIHSMKASDIYAIIKSSITKDHNKNAILNLMNENVKKYANYIKVRIGFDRDIKVKHEIINFNFQTDGCLSSMKGDLNA